MRWWNALSEDNRAYWLKQANNAVPAEAYAAYKRRFAAPGVTASLQGGSAGTTGRRGQREPS